MAVEKLIEIITSNAFKTILFIYGGFRNRFNQKMTFINALAYGN